MTTHLKGQELLCPFNPRHSLSADRASGSYYCYVCGEHYTFTRAERPTCAPPAVHIYIGGARHCQCGRKKDGAVVTLVG
jgi:hypothetical protein